MEVGAHVGATLAAGLADETIFDVGQAKVIGPLVGADRDRVAAVVVGGIRTPRTPDSRISPKVIFV